MNKPGDGHPISVVVRRTGLTQDILRAWEKRYRAVVPLRTATGRRLYTEDQVSKLRLLKQLVDGGRRISDVADLDLGSLRALAAEDSSEAVAVSVPPARRSAGGFLTGCIDAVERLDRPALEQTLDSASVALSRPRLRNEVVVPLIQALGERWRDGTWRVVHEHLASAVLRSFLWSMWHRAEPGPGASNLVVTTPSGQHHELGALLAAGIAADLGWRVMYLGPDLPAEEIAAATESAGSDAVLLSMVYPMPDPRLLDEVRRLRKLVGNDVMLVAGGRSALAMREELESSGVTVVANMDELNQALTDRNP